MIKTLLLAGTGGFIGTVCRVLVQKWTSLIYSGSFPLGTFLVNIIGCLLIGLISGWLERKGQISALQTSLLIAGFCGGFTTFSSFENDICRLASDQQWLYTFLYPLLSLILGFLSVLLGRAIIK